MIAEAGLGPDDAPHRQIANRTAGEAPIGFLNRPVGDGAPSWHARCHDELRGETVIRIRPTVIKERFERDG